ncbi:hypothetical protein [Kocuria sp. U4B]
MTTPAKPRDLLAHKGWLVTPALFVLLSLLYIVGVPWVVLALDGFWEGVDRLVEHQRLLSFLTALSWAVTALFVYRLYRLRVWDRRVLSALKAARAPSEEVRRLGRRSLEHLAQNPHLPREEQAWLSALLGEDHDEHPEQRFGTSGL